MFISANHNSQFFQSLLTFSLLFAQLSDVGSSRLFGGTGTVGFRRRRRFGHVEEDSHTVKCRAKELSSLVRADQRANEDKKEGGSVMQPLAPPPFGSLRGTAAETKGALFRHDTCTRRFQRHIPLSLPDFIWPQHCTWPLCNSTICTESVQCIWSITRT